MRVLVEPNIIKGQNVDEKLSAAKQIYRRIAAQGKTMVLSLNEKYLKDSIRKRDDPFDPKNYIVLPSVLALVDEIQIESNGEKRIVRINRDKGG